MAQSFYWYDLETSGLSPKWDRIVQFAGLRTDMDLNPLGDEFCEYASLADDVLPSPDASLVTGITPKLAADKGGSEWQLLTLINRLFSDPGTCAVGYNSLRFDDEFVRYGLYRNLQDPYAREWQGGNSRWDILDLVRATGALRREGINWPVDEEGLPVYRLEILTKANDIEHGNAHDALSDVRATVAFARLIKKHQPKLFDYYFSLRRKKAVKALLEPFNSQILVHITGMYSRARYGFAPIVSLCRHPSNANSIIVADLSQDVECLLDLTEQELRDRLFTAGVEDRPPLKEVKLNRCPFVATLDVLNTENIERLQVNEKLIAERHRRLRKPGLAQKLMRVFAGRGFDKATDVDAALYDGFLQDEDRSRCTQVQQALAQDEWLDMDFKDKRLVGLAGRLKARSFSARMTVDEAQDWAEYVRQKLSQEDGGWLGIQAFNQRIEDLSEHNTHPVLEALRKHGATLAKKYHL